ncbi:Hexaprenyldihydroxybenzoate methyltransferase, mitochondrial [Teratosphaeriaceae sp. CCFEE 6253]|nr:Hexaprenyldihydroxybenzoate methyltransferase, mitochondrial [Teratosphaeriaceae sp. CCFEE 6253]
MTRARHLDELAIDPISACASSHLPTNGFFFTFSTAPAAKRSALAPIRHHATESSVNQTEVTHFNALASSWWDPHGGSRLLHLMNPLRHDFLHRCLAPEVRDPHQKLRFLDVGCGGGIFAESAARLASTESVMAIDPTPEVIAVARKHARTDPRLMEPGRLTYKQVAIEELQTPRANQYDVVSVFEVIEHIRNPYAFLTSVLPHLKPGGWLIGSTIARSPVSWLTTKLVAEDLLRIVPRGTHDWSQYLNPQEIRDWARREERLSTSEGLGWHTMGVVYVPGMGWREVKGSETWGNYFFGVKKREDAV